MDGENNGKSYEQMDDLGGNTPIFGVPPTCFLFLVIMSACWNHSPEINKRERDHLTVIYLGSTGFTNRKESTRNLSLTHTYIHLTSCNWNVSKLGMSKKSLDMFFFLNLLRVKTNRETDPHKSWLGKRIISCNYRDFYCSCVVWCPCL